MIYVYRRVASEGANQLVEDICLQGVRARRTQGRLLQNLQAGDHLVCWGDHVPRIPQGVQALNNVAPLGKFAEAQRLAQAGVATVQVSREPRHVRHREPFLEQYFALPVVGRPPAGRVNVADAEALATRLNQFVVEQRRRREHYDRQPAVVEEWLPRRNNHIGGSDLLTRPAQPDYYSKKEDIIEEYRLHMFRGKSIRAGVKRQRPRRPNGQPSHPWIRSFDAGWIIAYEGFRSTKPQRDLAAKALEALGLDFGAVDLALTRDGRLIVLEVNRAPGIEGGTAATYATKVIEWSRGR